MKIEQPYANSSTALLCSTTSVDTHEKKSLCCAAAGITSTVGATAQALIPHKKLRRAAKSDATLIARNRPPAQPVLGYRDFRLGDITKPISGPLYWPADHRDCLPEEWFLLSPGNLSHIEGMLEAWLLPDAAQLHIADLLGRPFE
jgi:hypothetical protein